LSLDHVMRLTLRTLLAYLDNTLDPQDADDLRQKLSESGRATELVQRIRNTLASRDLASPSPQAVGPVEEANVISEYLDSTLPSEQVAEIERACQESDLHLAEAAACHQILTLVLGRKAEVSPELRQRIYQLPEKNVEEIAAAAGSFSSVSIPDELAIGSGQDAILTSEADSATRTGRPVQPVGKGDSGVSDAPTRIRQTAVGEDGAAKDKSAIAGSKPRGSHGAAAIYGGRIRTSRIAPWLLSLALAAVLLFLLTRIFSPLLTDDRLTSSGVDPALGVDSGGDVASQTPLVNGEIPDESSQPTTESGNTELVPVGEAQPDDGDDSLDSDAPPLPEASPLPEALPAPEPSTTVEDLAPAVTVTPKSDSPESVETAADKSQPGAPEMATELAAPVGSPSADAEKSSDVTSVAPPGGDAEESLAAPEQVSGQPAAAAPRAEAATVTAESFPTLLTARIDSDEAGKWVRLSEGMSVVEGVTVVCAPTFRGRMESVTGVVVTMVGPTQIRWTRHDDVLTIQVDFGRVLLAAAEPDVSVNVMLADQPVRLHLPDVDTVVAVSARHLRLPGADPLAEGNRTSLAGVLLVRGTATLDSGTSTEMLVTGQQWIRRGDSRTQVSTLEAIPEWIDPPDPNESTLESAARQGLIAILAADQPLDLSLREASGFRQAEVAALAAQALLFMGRVDVYFGGDGILSEPKQMIYWPDHYRALMEAYDQTPEMAGIVSESVADMDSANAASISRLLIGYSQDQLKAGGDEELVKLLDSPSMSVRVLALENLRKITGTILYFRADQDNAVRRDPGIKKWEVWQRKGDIRWPE
jgi:hypothetical protein